MDEGRQAGGVLVMVMVLLIKIPFALTISLVHYVTNAYIAWAHSHCDWSLLCDLMMHGTDSGVANISIVPKYARSVQ